MTETRAVLLGFAAMAFVLLTGAGWFVLGLFFFLSTPPDPAETQAVNGVFRAKVHTFDPIRGLETVFPSGTAWTDAATKLDASKFDCRTSKMHVTCFRNTATLPCNFDRRIEISLDTNGKVASTTATENPICL